MAASNKLLGLEYMRGIAAFFVAFGHLTWPLWEPKALVDMIGKPAASLVATMPNHLPRFYEVIPSSLFLVNCFFLLSGYVIQMSMMGNKPIPFLIQRFFRIYPVFFLSVLGFLLFWEFKGLPQPSLSTLFSEGLLIHGVSLNHAAWTLIYEIKFYLICAFFMLVRLDIRWRCVFVIVLMFVGLALDFARVPHIRLVSELTGIGMWITFMNVGSLAYFVREQYLQDGRVDPKLIKFCAFVVMAFIVGCLFMEHAPVGKAHYNNRDAAAFLGAFVVLVTLLTLEHMLPKIRFLPHYPTP